MVARTDDELVRAAKAGEEGAFDALMRRYERLVFRVVADTGGARDEALDLCQTVFLKAFGALSSFRGDSAFKTWLLRIAHHEALNCARGARRRPAGDELEPDAPELATPGNQERELLAKERSGRLAGALRALRGRYRTAIVLRYRDGLAIREIADVLDVSETMTKNLLFRGVRQLRRALAEGS